MPIKRIIYTLGEIKDLVAKEHGVERENIRIFESNEILLRDGSCDINNSVDDNTLLLEFDLEG